MPGIEQRHPWVVFTIRPEQGRRHRTYIRSESTVESVETVWYKGVLPPQASDIFLTPRVMPTRLAKFRDGYHFALEMIYRADQGPGFSWIVNSDGRIVSTKKTDLYARNPDLPRLEDFRLGELPPIVSTAKNTDASSRLDDEDP